MCGSGNFLSCVAPKATGLGPAGALVRLLLVLHPTRRHSEPCQAHRLKMHACTHTCMRTHVCAHAPLSQGGPNRSARAHMHAHAFTQAARCIPSTQSSWFLPSPPIRQHHPSHSSTTARKSPSCREMYQRVFMSSHHATVWGNWNSERGDPALPHHQRVSASRSSFKPNVASRNVRTSFSYTFGCHTIVRLEALEARGREQRRQARHPVMDHPGVSPLLRRLVEGRRRACCPPSPPQPSPSPSPLP